MHDSIWFAAFQPCGTRLAALLPEWLPAYQTDHRRLDADLRESLLAVSGRTTRVYGEAQTPLCRVLAAAQVTEEKKTELQALHARLNPFQLHRDIERQKKQIAARRLFQA